MTSRSNLMFAFKTETANIEELEYFVEHAKQHVYEYWHI